MEALLLSFGVVFVAELGDKSQLMTLAFAARYSLGAVLAGLVGASALVMGASVLVGAAVGDVLPEDAAAVVAGLVFLAVAAWTLRGEDDGEEDEAATARPARSAVLSVGGALLLAELGDKTMLATMTLASTRGALSTWAGATLGMVAANLLAVAGGRALGARLSARTVRLGAALLFAVFGVVLVVEGLLG